ncbi:MAG: serine protease, partial [Xanthomonadales bacterium]|nr:serine protease [Xanthomonadales bacterium]
MGFILTAEHVTAGADEFFVIRQGENPDGVPYKPEWTEAFLVAEDPRMDLAILMVRDRKFINRFKHTTILAPSDPRVGDTVHHVGSFLGDDGFNSYSKGKISYLYRSPEVNGSLIHLHQMTAAAYPGSSGGGVYNSHGQYIGTLVRGYDSSFTLFVPLRFIRSFL